MRTGAGYFDSGAESGEPQVEPGNPGVGPGEEHEAELDDVPGVGPEEEHEVELGCVPGAGHSGVEYDEGPVAELGTVPGVGREGYPGTWLGGAHEIGQIEVELGLFVKGVGRRGEGH